MVIKKSIALSVISTKKIKNPKIPIIFDKKIVFSIICDKFGSNHDSKFWMPLICIQHLLVFIPLSFIYLFLKWYFYRHCKIYSRIKNSNNKFRK